jgi:hypothetical protein
MLFGLRDDLVVGFAAGDVAADALDSLWHFVSTS